MPSALWFWEIDGSTAPLLTLNEITQWAAQRLSALEFPRNTLYDALVAQNPGPWKIGTTLRIRLPQNG